VSETTAGSLLGGKVCYRQPREGFRSGIEPVLLAAAVPARAGEKALEAGTGAGAGLLCLAARVPGIAGTGVEKDPLLAALARENLAANGVSAITILEADIETFENGERFAHSFANPPWHEQAGTPPSHPARMSAKRGGARLASWIGAMARRTLPGGSLTLILPAARAADALQAAAMSGCGGMTLFPFWPRSGSPAKLILLRAIRGSRSPFRMLAGLVLHKPDGRFTDEAEGILRDGAPIALDGRIHTRI